MRLPALPSIRLSRIRVGAPLVLVSAPVLAVVIGLLGGSAAHASVCTTATNTWTGGGGNGSWETAANWSAGHAPTSSDYVCVPSVTGLTLTVAGADTAAAAEIHSPLALSAGSLTLTDSATMSTVDSLTMTGGTLTGAGSLTLTGSGTWSSTGAMTGSGTTVIASSASLTISGASNGGVTRPLSNAGTVTFSLNANQVWGFGVGASFTNSGTLLFTTDARITNNGANNAGVTVMTNTSTGVIRKTAGTGSSSIEVLFANNGIVSADTGSIGLYNGDGTGGTGSTGSYTNVNFGSGTYTLATGSTLGGVITGSGATVNQTGSGSQTMSSLAISAGTFSENQSLSVGTLTLSGGTLSGSGTVTLTGAGTWTGGASMSGSGTTTVGSTGSLTLSGASADTLARTLSNSGTVTFAVNANQTWQFGPGASFTNSGTLLFTTDARITNNGVNNAGVTVMTNTSTGVIRKTAGTGSSSIEVLFANNGTLSADTGTISLYGGDGTGGVGSTGSYTNVAFGSGTYTLATGSTLTGAVSATGATVNQIGTGNQSVSSLAISAGTFSENQSMSVATLTLSGGSLAGSGTVTLTGAGTWTGTGSMSGSGATAVASGGSLMLSGASNGGITRALSNAGTVTFSLNTNQVWGFGIGASFTNSGTLLFTTDARITNNGVNNAGVTVMTNTSTGVIRKTAGTGSSSIEVLFVNNGTVSADTGSIGLYGGDGTNGTGSTGAYTNVNFGSGTYTLATGSALTGAITASGATVNQIGTGSQTISSLTISAGTFSENQSLSVGTLALSAGTLSGNGTVNLTGSGIWTGGASMSGAGTTAVGPTGSLTLSGASADTLGRTLSNAGTVTFSLNAGQVWQFGASASFTNSGTLLFTTDARIYNNGANTAGVTVMMNTPTGVIRKTAGTGSSSIEVLFVNNGTVSADTGSIGLYGGDGTGGAGGSGTFNNVAFTTGTYTFDAGATLTGSATANGATLNITGLTTVSGSLALTSGLIGGSGTLEVTGALNWGGATMTDAGATDVASGATMTLTGSSAHTLTGGRLLDTSGTTNWTGGGALSAGANTTISNSGTFTVGDTEALSQTGPDPKPLLYNTGTFITTGTSATAFSCGCDLNNQGTLRVDAGTTTIQGRLVGYNPTRQSLTGGRYVLTGTLVVSSPTTVTTLASDITYAAPAAAFTSNSAPVLQSLASVTPAGALTVTGGATATISGSLASAGSLTVGANSTLTVTGSYTETAGTTTAAGTLAAGGGATLTGGTLTGTGTINANLTNNGASITPAGTGTIGTLTVSGTLGQNSGVLHADIDGASSDALAVTGTATLGGTLDLVTTGNPASTGTVFPLLTYSSRTGGFSNVTGAQLADGDLYRLSDSGTVLDATVSSASTAGTPTVTVNNGAARTNNPTVTVAVTAPAGFTATGMRLANDGTPAGAYSPYATTSSWTLPAANTTHTVDVQLHDGLGNASAVGTASILLDTIAPTAAITLPTSPTGIATISFSEAVTGAATTNITLEFAASGTALPVTLACRDQDNTAVNCATGTFVTVTVTPTAPLLPNTSYRLTVDPTGASPVRDLAGNATPLTSSTFTV
jgi:hypothetical protein